MSISAEPIIPINMDKALVAALRRDLFRCQFHGVDEEFRITLAKRDVADRSHRRQRP
jgi:hypothetical protein